MTAAERYTYRVHWSGEDESFVGTVAEFASLSWTAGSQWEALVGIRALVDGVLDDLASTGEEPPVAIGDRRFSGRFVVRISPQLHRRLVTEAAEQHVSLNQLAASRLVG